MLLMHCAYPMFCYILCPLNTLEKAEHDIYLDVISFGQHAKKRPDSVLKQERCSMLKRYEIDDDETHRAKCHGSAMQGD